MPNDGPGDRGRLQRTTVQLGGHGSITTHFQPIVDVVSASTIAFELLSRGQGPDGAPERMFELARQRGTSWDVERACRSVAMRRIAELPGERRGRKWFLNVSPDIFSDPRFMQGFTLRQIERYGLHQDDVVIEITERDSIRDHTRFEQIVRHYVDQGFQIAVDDFGSGHSSLVTLLAVLPHYIKLDMAIVRDLHKRPYQQLLVKSIVSFATSVQAKLIAEGVETWDELETLVRLGVRYVQGFLLARPAELPPAVTGEVTDGIRSLVRRTMLARGDLEDTARVLVLRTPSVEVGASRATVAARFQDEPTLDHVVVVDGRRPAGLLRRDALEASGHAYSMAAEKPVGTLASAPSLVVPDSIQVTQLARLAMERDAEQLYDPAIVVDAGGGYLGTISMKQLIVRSADLETQLAQAANPLTGLPGGRVVDAWIRRALERETFTIVYADLDHFDEYNDRYGFAMGDELIRLLARVLVSRTSALGDDARLGHLGGDDFVVLVPARLDEPWLDGICADFDRLKREAFDAADWERGAFTVADRTGQPRDVPLVTLGLAAVGRVHLGDAPHPGALSQVSASLRKRVKAWTAAHRRSGWAVERRAPR